MNNAARAARYTSCFVFLLAAAAVLAVVSVNAGSVPLPASEIARIIFLHSGDPNDIAIVWQLRMPRIITALLLGGALSVSGFLLQTFFHNPLAGPFVLGISGGAKLFVALVMILLLDRGIRVGSAGLVAAAFCGSMVSLGFVLLAAGRVKNMAGLVVCGVMISYICSAATEIAVNFADDTNIVNLHNWSMGSFAGTTWQDILIIALIVLPAAGIVFLLSKPIGAYQMGEAYALTLGVHIPLLRSALIVLSGLLSACVTAFAGPASFVDIAVPHLMKQLLGTSRPLVLTPACFLGGAVFCMFCDLISRTLFAPTILSVSSVTAVFGAPVVIVMMIRRHEQT